RVVGKLLLAARASGQRKALRGGRGEVGFRGKEGDELTAAANRSLDLTGNVAVIEADRRKADSRGAGGRRWQSLAGSHGGTGSTGGRRSERFQKPSARTHMHLRRGRFYYEPFRLRAPAPEAERDGEERPGDN